VKRICLGIFFFLSIGVCFAGEFFYEDIDSYLLAQEHPLYPVLDRLLASSEALISVKHLKKAGFSIIEQRPSTLVLAKHPALPGYLIKVYLHSSIRTEEVKWRNLVNRCKGAENIRRLIFKENIRYFTVPDKWLYITKQQDLVLIATYMPILSKEESKYVWKNLVTKEQLEELYLIISHGYGSTLLPHNIPYMKSGSFACIDTEIPQRVPRYSHAKAHLSDKMGKYWDKLVAKGQNHE
jgi:hypothetical protein